MLSRRAMRPTEQSSHAETIFDLAKRDHRLHVARIDRVQAETSMAGRARAVAELAADLRRHSQAEHASLIGRLLADSDVRPLARTCIADHERLTRLVSDLPYRDDFELSLALSAYRAAFLEYARYEEQELFPAAMHALGLERCQRAAADYRRTKSEPLDYMLAR